MNTAVCSAALIRQAVLGRGSIPGPTGVDLEGGQCSGESAGQEACAKEPSLGSRGPGPSARDNVAGIPGALHASTTSLWPSTHGAHSGLEGLWMVTLSPRLPSPGVPILAASFPVTSASSHDGFSRALWQDLERVCVRRGVKGNVEERMTLNPWPSVVSLCTTSQDRSCDGLSVPQFPGGGIMKCRRLVASLGTTVGKPVPQGISWAKACGVLPAPRAR